MNGKLILGMLILVMGFAFAAPNVTWASPTPANNTDYWNTTLMFNMTSNESWSNVNTWIEVDGVNKSCTPDITTNKSCNVTLAYLEKIHDHNYTVIGWANISNTSVPTDTRIVVYTGCGFVNANTVLKHDLGGASYSTNCLIMNRSGIIMDGDGYIVEVDNSTAAISANSLENLTITYFEADGGAWTVLLLGVNHSTVDNFQVFGIPGSTAGVFLSASNDNNISGGWVEGYGYGIYMSASSNYNNVSDNDLTENVVGILAGDTGNVIDSNRIFDNTGDGIILTTPTAIAVDRNEIYGNPIGVQVSNSNVSVFWSNHYYNNSIVDYYMSNTNNVSYLNFISYDDFDNPLGNHVNFTRVASMDYVGYNDSYSISWNAFGTTPTNLSVFRGKAIAIDDGVLSSDPIIEEIVLFWNISESSGYNESSFALWREVFPGTFTLINGSPNTAGNYILMYDTNVSGWGRYGILYNTTTTPIPDVPGNVTDAETLVIISNFISVALIFIILFIIVGSFGLQKWFDFKDMFVPLMVGALLIILAIGLFL